MIPKKKKGWSELSTVDIDFESSSSSAVISKERYVSQNLVLSIVTSKFQQRSAVRTKRSKSELSTVSGDFESAAAVISIDLSTG